MKMTNFEIYDTTEKLLKAFSEDETQKLPIKLSFCIQKNIKKMRAAAEEIEKSRMSLLEKYGNPTEDGRGYEVPNENIETVNQEFSDLMEIEQDIAIHMIDINSISDTVELSNAQMEAMMFMIKDEDEAQEA